MNEFTRGIYENKVIFIDVFNINLGLTMKNIILYFLLFIFQTISMCFCLIPRSFCISIGRQIGNISYILSIRKKVVEKNISIAFKNLDRSEKKTILLNCYRHFGIVLIDFLRQKK